METVHKADLLPWISEPIDLKQMLQLGKESPLDDYLDKKSLKEILQDMCPSMDFEKVENECFLDHYYNPLEQKITLGKQFEIPENVNLKTLRLQKSHADKRAADLTYDVFCYNSSKCRDYPWGKPLVETVDELDLSNSDLINLPEVILTVQIYHPIRRNPNISAVRMQIDQEFHVIGQQYLTELCDKIICISNEAVIGEWSDIPNHSELGQLAKNCYKSSLFYFGTTFYNDCRFPNNLNYGQELKDWADKHAKGIGPFEYRSMEHTRFIDLTIRLGYPYVFIHQGYCEHVIVVTDARLMTKDDILTLPSYPMRSRVFPKKAVSCMVCNKAIAKWIVTKSRKLPEEPFAFCDTCHKIFNYDEDGHKTGQFEARVLPDRSAII